MIPAHGAQLSVTATSIHIEYSPLSAALTGQAVRDIPLAEVTDVQSTVPSLLDVGLVTLAGPDTTVTFAPGQEAAAADFVAAVEAALRGEAPADPAGISGLSFIGFDVETANPDVGSICQIGVVRVVDGIEVAAESWLCVPPPGLEEFEAGNIAVHGIRPGDVADQPAFAERLPELLEFIGDLPLIAHNAQFDMMALRRACLAADLPVPELTFGCSLVLARAAKLGLPDHRLPTVAAALDVPLVRHHDAAEDARAAAGILVALAHRAQHRGPFAELQQSSGFVTGTLTQEAVQPVLRQGTGAPAPSRAPRKASPSRRAPWQSVATPEVIPEPNPDADPTGPLFGQNVTLTGDFEPFDKGRLWSAIADLGAEIGKNVTRKTTILVAGTWATKTSKEKRAEELIAKGQDLQIWTGDQLIAVLGLSTEESEDEQPPF